MGRRERKRRATRRALTDAAARLFAEHGFEQVRVEDIAAAAGVSTRTYFRYFPTKEAVAFPHHEGRLRRFAELVQVRIPGEEPLAAAQRAFVALGSHLMDNRDEELALQRNIDGSPALIAADRARDREWDEVLASALADGGTPDHRQRVAAGAVMGAVRASLRLWLDDDGRGDLVSMGLDAFALLARGLASADLSGGGTRDGHQTLLS